MKTIVQYNIEQFNAKGNASSFYTNTISAHLRLHGVSIPQRNGFYSSFLFTNGSGVNDIDLDSYVIGPGYVFTLHPGQVHKWQLSADIEGYLIFHTKEFYNQNFTYERIDQFPFYGIGGPALIVLTKTAFEIIEPIFENILLEYNQNQLMRLQKICSMLNVFYIELSQVYMPQRQSAINNNQYNQIKRLEGLIDENYKTIKFPKQYASLMHMSQKHLNRIVKSNLNKTTSDLISERVILEAKRMLIYSAHTVSQIALELGYPDKGYFSRMFKNKSGLTPVEFIDDFRKN